MTLNQDFIEDLVGLYDPITGLGEVVDLDGNPVNALVHYDMDMDEHGATFGVVELDILISEVPELPEYRAEAEVDGKTWYFWKQVSCDTISRKLRFRANQKFTSGR